MLKVKLCKHCKHIKLRILVDCRHFVKKKRALQFLHGSWKAFCLPILCEIIHPWRLFCLLTLLLLRCLSRCQKHDRTPAPRTRWSSALTQCVYPTLAAPWAVNNDTGGSLTFNSLQVGGTFSNSRFTQTLMDFTTIQKKKCLVSFTGTEKMIHSPAEGEGRSAQVQKLEPDTKTTTKIYIFVQQVASCLALFPNLFCLSVHWVCAQTVGKTMYVGDVNVCNELANIALLW